MREMHDCAPDEWMYLVVPNYESYGKEKARYPLITKKRNINWLFLLSQMIGCCKIEHLNYFCKHVDTPCPSEPARKLVSDLAIKTPRGHDLHLLLVMFLDTLLIDWPCANGRT